MRLKIAICLHFGAALAGGQIVTGDPLEKRTSMRSEAVIVVLKDELGRFLVGKRSPENSIAPNVWTPISGTIEPHETEAEAVVRECREELGIEVEPITKVNEMNASLGVERRTIRSSAHI